MPYILLSIILPLLCDLNSYNGMHTMYDSIISMVKAAFHVLNI